MDLNAIKRWYNKKAYSATYHKRQADGSWTVEPLHSPDWERARDDVLALVAEVERLRDELAAAAVVGHA